MVDGRRERVGRPTRNDVARLAGVTPSTVSYVLNPGIRSISEETRQRVFEAIDELGYRPNSVARALRSRKTATVGLSVPNSASPYFAALALEIQKVGRERGVAALLSDSAGGGPELGGRDTIHDLIAHEIDALFVSTLEPESAVAQARNAGIPVVVLDRTEPFPGARCVGADWAAGTELAVGHLLSHGLTTIHGLLARDPVRVETWTRTIESAGLIPGRRLDTDYGRDSTYQLALDFIPTLEYPCGVFAGSDLEAIGFLRAAHELGVRVPEDVALVTFDGTVEVEYTWPALTTVLQPVAELARAAFDVLDDPEDAAPTVLAPHGLRLRHSCGCPGH